MPQIEMELSRKTDQNLRADYVNAVLEKLINWEFARQNLG